MTYLLHYVAITIQLVYAVCMLKLYSDFVKIGGTPDVIVMCVIGVTIAGVLLHLLAVVDASYLIGISKIKGLIEVQYITIVLQSIIGAGTLVGVSIEWANNRADSYDLNRFGYSMILIINTSQHALLLVNS
jgi:hypothetical protein